MAGLQILLTQIEGRLETLRAANGLLESDGLRRLIGGQLEPHFAIEFANRVRSLVALRTSLAQRAPDADLGDGWSRLEQESRAIERLYDRFLTHVQAETFRAAGFDHGAALVADGLLTELAALTDLPWRRQAVVGGGDVFEEATEVISVRFPQYSIWLLPVVAHELGHFAASRLRREDGTPVRAMIAGLAGEGLTAMLPASAKVLQAQRADFLEELFADVFATWLLGPAYACTCLELELNPNDAGDRRHPPATARARAILGCLSWLDADSVGRPYARVLKRLSEVWPSAGRSTSDLDVAEATGQFISLLQTRLPPQA
ncbi:MAG TPA: hypothetical protein VLE53_10175, partial [Gemmatimonadaceae bacterium]|nr:hypothetical protein [Gemmatimonadaceae bacterium]